MGIISEFNLSLKLSPEETRRAYTSDVLVFLRTALELGILSEIGQRCKEVPINASQCNIKDNIGGNIGGNLEGDIEEKTENRNEGRAENRNVGRAENRNVGRAENRNVGRIEDGIEDRIGYALEKHPSDGLESVCFRGQERPGSQETRLIASYSGKESDNHLNNRRPIIELECLVRTIGHRRERWEKLMDYKTAIRVFDYLISEKNQRITTVHRKLAALKKFEHALHLRGIINNKSLFNLRLPKYKRNQQKVFSHQTVGELRKELTVASYRYNKKYDAIIALLYGNGLRVSEVANIKLSDINLKESSFMTRVKGGATKNFLMPSGVQAAVKAYVDGWEIYNNSVASKNKRYLFPGKNGGKMNTRSLYRIVNGIGKRIGISISPHDLRRSMATSLYQKGASVDKVRDFLGHRHTITTEQYICASADQKVVLKYNPMHGEE